MRTLSNDEIARKVAEYVTESRSRCYCGKYRKPCGYHEGMQDGTDLVQDLLTGSYRTAPVDVKIRLAEAIGRAWQSRKFMMRRADSAGCFRGNDPKHLCIRHGEECPNLGPYIETNLNS